MSPRNLVDDETVPKINIIQPPGLSQANNAGVQQNKVINISINNYQYKRLQVDIQKSQEVENEVQLNDENDSLDRDANDGKTKQI